MTEIVSENMSENIAEGFVEGSATCGETLNRYVELPQLY
jgi:hypothetical protein